MAREPKISDLCPPQTAVGSIRVFQVDIALGWAQGRPAPSRSPLDFGAMVTVQPMSNDAGSDGSSWASACRAMGFCRSSDSTEIRADPGSISASEPISNVAFCPVESAPEPRSLGAAMAMTEPAITISVRELDRGETVQCLVDRMLPVGLAAQRLGLSRRQLERLVLKSKARGSAGLVSAKRGRPTNHQLTPGDAHLTLSVIRDRSTRKRAKGTRMLQGDDGLRQEAARGAHRSADEGPRHSASQ